jgi:beta-phosphoglucomutase-like phosphatase (HAD superfamily)
MEIQSHEIAFDFDGVVADTFRLFVEMARRDFNVEIDYNEITSTISSRP